MKNNLLFLMALFFFIGASAQDAKKLVRMTFTKCNSIKNGTYEMTDSMKYMSDRDTVVYKLQCSFGKLKINKTFPSAFHLKVYYNNKYDFDALYTGNETAWYNENDSNGVLTQKSKWPKEVRREANSRKVFKPLLNISFMVPQVTDLLHRHYKYQLKGIEILNGDTCYHVKVSEKKPNRSSDGKTIFLNVETDYWIKKKDSIPVQYSQTYVTVLKQDTEYQYEKMILNNYQLNQMEDESLLSLNSIPSYVRMKEYSPKKVLTLIPKDSMAPEWNLPKLDSEKVRLKDLQGKLVLIDFFYKGCYYCNLAMPGLQSIHEKYKAQGLQVVGIDPFDSKDKDLGTFLQKQGVTYTVVMGSRLISDIYRVSGYPTVYLIDRNGKIIYSQSGYSKEQEKKLEEVIKKNL